MFLTDDGQAPVYTPLSGKAIMATCAAVILLTGTLLIGPLKNTSDHLATDLYQTATTPTAVAMQATP